MYNNNKVMNKLNYLLTIVFIVFSGIFFACSEKDGTEPETTQGSAPAFQGKSIEVPQEMVQSSNPGAQESMSYIAIANSFTGYTGMFVPPQKSGNYKSTNEGSPWVYSWEVNDQSGSFTVTLTVNENDYETTWAIVLNGEMDGIPLVDFTYLYGEESQDGKSGMIRLYDPESNSLGFETSWATENNVDTFRFYVPEELEIMVNQYPDNSGSLNAKEWTNGQLVLSFSAIWTASGSGEAWEYYENGSMINHETW
ncbi:MAG: hypothetical protein R2764_10780 [Bacteroidales bacterium]